MNIIDLIQRAASTIEARKHLMVLGMLFVIVTSGIRLQDQLIGPMLKPLFALFDLPANLLPPDNTNWIIQLLIWVEAHGTAGWIGLVAGVVVLGISIGVIAIVARGALIASAGAVDTPISLGAALKAGWRTAWRLIIIASIPPIPVTIAAILIVVLATVVIQRAGGVNALAGSAELQQQIGGGLLAASMVILFPFSVVTYALGLLSTLADRACVLEDRRVIESYRRGWEMLRANSGSAVLLALLHLVASSLIASALALPGMLSLVCSAVTPLLWIAHGIETSYFVTLWTLAWREWAGSEPAGNTPIEKIPAV